MNTVFVVLYGEDYESSEMLHICSTKDIAIRLAKLHMKKNPPLRKKRWKKVSDTYWRNDCQFIEIEEVNVCCEMTAAQLESTQKEGA